MADHIDEKLFKRMTNFLDDNPSLFVFMADPESDTILAGHKKKVIAKRIVDRPDGEMLGEIAEALNYKRGKHARGQLVMKFASMIHNIARDLADVSFLKKLISPKNKKVKK